MTLPGSSPTTDSPGLTRADSIDESALMPQTIASVFDEAFDLYKRHFALLAMMVAVGLIPIELLRNVVIAVWLHPLDAHLSGLKETAAVSQILLVLGQLVFGEPRAGFPGILSLSVQIVLGAPVAVAISDLYFGRTPNVRDCYRRCRPYLLGMVGGYGLVFLVSVGVLAVSAIAIACVFGLIALPFVYLRLPDVAAAIFLIPTIVLPYFACMGFIARNFVFLTPLTILEGQSASYASVRNFQLIGKKRFARTWAATAALPILIFSFEAILTNSIGPVIQMLHVPSLVDFILSTAVSTAVHLFLAPYWIIFVTLLYYDYRVRREGLDLRMLSLVQPSEASNSGGRP